MKDKNEIEYSIYPSRDGANFEVAHWHTYEEGSVLAGQQQEVIDEIFSTVADALKGFPDAKVCLKTFRCDHKPSVPICPPRNFDYLDAGEYWGEDDY